MSMQGIQTTTITMAEGPNDLCGVFARLAMERPDLVKRLPIRTTLWEERYEISKEGQRDIAAAIVQMLF